MAEAIFHIDGDLFVPTDLARGPWSPKAQHGGPPSALLARAAARFEDGERMFVARVTVELMRPVPLSPLAVRTRFGRPGRKVQLVGASLFAGETEVARCTALRIQRVDIEMPKDLPQTSPPPAPETGRDTFPPWAGVIAYEAYHSHAVEHRFVAGGFEGPGPAVDWIRLRVPLVDGEQTSPLCRVVAVADFGNGVSWILNRTDGYLFINPDLTVYLHRDPLDEWVCLDAETQAQDHGVGLAESRLFDRRGPIGRSLQSLLIEKV